MANKDDHLKEYRSFFENFANSYNPHDQLPVKLGSYKLCNTEVVGAIIDWTTQYLNQKECPQPLLSPLIKIIIQEVRSVCKKEPTACGFNPVDNVYEPLRFMKNVIGKTNEVCQQYLDNSKLCSLPAPGSPFNVVSACAIKNSRRRMEDRHVIVHDLSTLFTNKEVSPSSYYAIFDGHAGHDAAVYSCAHLHQFLGESEHFCTNPELALREAFLKTDNLFNEKCKTENFRSGTTAICALLRHKEKMLYIAWVGDSQAVLVSQSHCLQCVQSHKPCREDEKRRIEDLGGTILFWGSWRVNGQLAVSRAIGDLDYKPFVTAVPDITKIPLTGNEDFLIIACDGLWDVVSERAAAQCVYQTIAHNQDDIEAVSEHLVQLAKQQGSSDNISVIVVFLREPSKTVAEAHWATRHSLIMDTLDNANATNPFVNSNNPEILSQKEGFVLNLAEGCKQNGTENVAEFFERSANGKRSFEDDEDLGPETDVDCIEELSYSLAPVDMKNLLDNVDIYCENKEEKAALEIDSQKYNKFETLREETPTPPADSVQDTSGLVDNVAESGEESEDEWNYFKGDQAEKENIEPSESDKKISDLDDVESDDTMSQLNPNAAEFVPVSPKRDVTSPVYQALMDDLVIAQSPKRFANNDIDIKVPNPQEFETEIKSRPGDLIESANVDESDNVHNLSSQEIMENLLNGKTIEEIEFQPSLPKPSEFHFGPNSTPFSTPGKLMDQSTKAVIGDESNYLSESLSNDLQNKEENCMSMSFYQDDEEEPNALDLNKVQVLPENIDEFLDKPKEECEPTFTDKVQEKEFSQLPIEVEVNICERLSPFKDNLSVSSGNLGSQSSIPELQSPTPEDGDVLVADVEPVLPPKSPLMEMKSSVFDENQCAELNLSVESPVLEESEREELKSPVCLPVFENSKPVFEKSDPVFEESEVAELKSPAQSPVFRDIERVEMKSPAHGKESPILAPIKHSEIPLLTSRDTDISPSEIANLISYSDISSRLSPELQIPQRPAFDVPIAAPLLSPTHNENLSESVGSSSLSSPLEEVKPFPVDEPPHDLLSSPTDEVTTVLSNELVDIPTRSPVPSQPILLDDSTKSPISSPVPEISKSPPPPSPVPRTQKSPLTSPVRETNPFLVNTSVKSPISSPIHEVKQFVEDVPINSVVSNIEIAKAGDVLEQIKSSQPPTDLPLIPTRGFSPQTQSPLSPAQPIQSTKSPQPVAHELDSPMEDVTSSVKDSPLPLASPTETFSEVIHKTDLLVENVSPKSVIDTESVATTDVNSFLERSLVPDMASPLSGDETQIVGVCYTGMENVSALIEDVEIKSEIIAPEFPVQMVTTPSQESKSEDVPIEIIDLTGMSPLDFIAKVEEKAKPLATATVKKIPGKTASPKPTTKAAPSTKPLPSKTSKPLPSKTVTSTASRAFAAKPAPKPAKVIEKKPLTNGDIKPLAKKPPTTVAPKTSLTTSKAAPTKLSPTKLAATKPTPTSTRPSPASTKLTPKVAAAKPSPTTTKQTKTSTAPITKPTTSTFSAKPKTTIPPAKPKTLAPKANAPDTEKQIKETTNKQLTASASANRMSSSPGKPLATTTRKPNLKPVTHTKTSVDAKKPIELVRHSTTKPKTTTTTGIKKSATKTVTNGVTSTKVSTTITTTETKLIKDVSPLIEKKIVDNSQIVEVNNTD
ncbi:hypothetical protein RI129_006821 [Pyrocoelia pectoralis]|uniref:PPM-type phosphatase domain-containing protein n=1 Tax=Pyrocoelia pectoralis TaxID=417401 RepID=A0AAN7VH20_9COLE